MDQNGHSPLRIICIGGGLGGLTFALAAQKVGINVEVYEQAAAFREIGNGIGLQRNPSILINEFLDLEEEYTSISAPSAPTHIDFRNWKTGDIAESLKHPSGSVNNRVHRVKRSEYLDMIRFKLPPEKLHTGKRLTELEKHEDHTYTAYFTDGTSVEADVVVDTAIFSGQKVYRALLPRSSFSEEEQKYFFTGVSNNFRGPDRHLLAFAVGNSAKELNIVAFVPEQAELSDSWTARGEVAMLERELEGWCQPVQRILEEMKRVSPTCLKQSLYYRQPLERWTDGVMVLLGDSAHPILPHQGSGTGMAIEDSVALALLLQNATRVNVANRLEAFEGLRKPRTDMMLTGSITMGKTSSSDHADKLTDADRQVLTDRTHIWNYDAREEAKKTLQALDDKAALTR